MKRLILMRHAKSSWDDPMLGDHERPLNGRGRISADALGDWLRAKLYAPDQALVSDSARTRETFARLNFICDTSFASALYHASPRTMIEVLKGAKGDTVLMVGHNPGIAEFAGQIVAQPPDHMRFYDYPTCATTVMEFDIDDWSELRAGTGRVLDFVIPREITP
ncbi:SixA phosphatase family protein [Roseovarius sp. 2305UL8-3]|uniref:SixA phosphatase family protein n=1 Tax=Roseovarius conchicola TaxID=3121636 RepID=UPI003528055D